MGSVQKQYPARALREYAVLADGQRGAVCGPSGEIVWMCAPFWHDDAVFSALLGGPGVYAITPADPHVWGGAYEPRSLIWRSHWATTRTLIESREALAYPGDPDKVVLLRRVLAVEKEATVDVELDVRARFGREPMHDPVLGSDGRWTAHTGDLQIRWSGAHDAHLGDDGVLRARISVPSGGHRDLVLEIGRGDLGEHVSPDEAWRNTEVAWDNAVPELSEAAAGPRDAQHAVAVLRGMTTPGNGMVAAVTMSLPERAEQGGNYDYRYSWIRDQCFAGVAAAAAGVTSLLDDAVAFVGTRLDEDGEHLAPAYTVHGEPIPDEQPLPHLPGYPGGQALVRGNRVSRQFQLDAFGEILQLLAAAAEHDRLDAKRLATAETAVDIIERNWQQPGAGLWELDNRWWTHSRLTCVAGLRRFAATVDFKQAGRMLTLADTILTETSRRCLHPDGHWQRSPDDARPDAAMLLPLVRHESGFADPRTTATVEAVRNRLSQDGYVYRFPQDPDPLGEREGAFLLCGFAMALADRQQGNEVWALRWFERHRAACGPPALLAEEYDVHQRQLRGNLPQGFVHAMLLESAVRLGPR